MTKAEKAIRFERRMKFVFFFLSLILLFVVITQTENLLVSFLLAFVNYFLLAPAVDFIERRGFSRAAATAIPFLLLTLISGICIWIFAADTMNQLKSLQENLPKYLESTNMVINKIETQISGVADTVFHTNIEGKIQPKIMAMMSNFMQSLPNILSNSLTIMLLAPFLSYFMLLNGREFVRKIVSMVPNHIFELVINLNYQISSQMGGFIRARLVETIILAILMWIGLELIHFPYALVLSIFAAVLNIIPYLGPIIGTLPAFVIAIANADPSSVYLQLTFVYLGVQIIDAVILVPFLVAKIVDLHPVTVILSIILGAQLMGTLGMIICIPVVSVLKVTAAALYRHFTDFRS